VNDANFTASRPGPGTLRAVFAMTLTQVLVVSALFAIPIAAPAIAAELRIDPSRVGLFTAIVFGVSIWSSVIGGNAAARFGGVRVSQVSLVLSALSLGFAILGSPWTLVLAAVVLGCAMGPETPASAHLLSRVVPLHLRPRLFSVRQTGNQFGAIAMSCFIPALTALTGWRAGFAIVAVSCLAYALVLEFDRRALLAHDIDPTRPPRRRLVDSLRVLRADPRLVRLTVTSVAFCATQICLNGFLVSYLVQDLGMDLVTAGTVMASAQTGGLFGRVGWGLVVERFGRVPLVLGALGVIMALSAATVSGFSSTWPFGAILAVAFVFGLTASGWNGVFLAEAARLSPPGRVGEITGALSMIIFVGLVVGPLVFSSLVATGLGYDGGFLMVSAIALVGTLAMIQRASAKS
jgi:MFS family permease